MFAAFVPNQVTGLVRTVLAKSTGERFFSRMNSRMFDEVTAVDASVRARGAFEAEESQFGKGGGRFHQRPDNAARLR